MRPLLFIAVMGCGLAQQPTVPIPCVPVNSSTTNCANAYQASATVSSAASATDIAALPGNATTTVLVTGLRVTCTQTTAGVILLQIVQRTTANSGGTSSNMTVVKRDSNSGAANSTPLTYTANPTTGSGTASDTYYIGCMASGTASPNDIYIQPYDWRIYPVVLHGTAQELVVNLNGTTVTGGSFTVTFDWIEK